MINNEGSTIKPLAITMWDFSWLERRWPGAGYEDWDKVLDELVERGYNAIRIDAFPHFISENSEKEWTLKPVWSVQDWGSPSLNKIIVQPYLNEFISKCEDRKIKIGLSSWFREDVDNIRMQISSPDKMADIWNITLNSIKKDNLLNNVFYVDLCNEWPGDLWCPYFKNDPPELTWGGWHTDTSMNWMKKSIDLVRREYPEIPLGFSIELNKSEFIDKDLSFFDYLEPHIWMSSLNNGEFYNKVGYKYDRFNNDSYNNLILNGKKIYEENEKYWQNILKAGIQSNINFSINTEVPLMTTECWGVVDFKDWPLLYWDWVKDLCALGTRVASDSGRWAAIATSNFCGPQFVGMWRDIDWHTKLTEYIKNSRIDTDLENSKLIRRMELP